MHRELIDKLRDFRCLRKPVTSRDMKNFIADVISHRIDPDSSFMTIWDEQSKALVIITVKLFDVGLQDISEPPRLDESALSLSDDFSF